MGKQPLTDALQNLTKCPLNKTPVQPKWQPQPLPPDVAGTGCLCFYAPRRSVAHVHIAEAPIHNCIVFSNDFAARTWQVPRYPLGLPHRELLQGASSVALRACHAPRRVGRAPPHPQGRGLTHSCDIPNALNRNPLGIPSRRRMRLPASRSHLLVSLLGGVPLPLNERARTVPRWHARFEVGDCDSRRALFTAACQKPFML